MTTARVRLRDRSLRVRITLTYVVSATVLVIVMSAATYFTVQRILEGQRVTSATRQTVFALLFARDFVGIDPERSQRVVSLLQRRESLEALVVEGDGWFSSSLSLTPAALPSELRDLVAQERLAYQETEVGGERVLVFGAPLPPPGVDLYLFFSLGDLDEILALLARVLLAVGLVVVLAAAVVAQRISRRLLQPLAAVSVAAQRVAEGLLETRVVTPSQDELGVLAASFNEMAGGLQRLIERERRFVASVSHELRTPLATLATTSELLLAHRDELDPSGREAVDLIVADVEDLRRLVEELLEVSELDSGKAHVNLEQVDLRALVEAMVARRRADVPVEGPPVVTLTDKARLQRIVGNLVDNALSHGEGADVRVRVRATDGLCEVTVSDRGPGIPAQDIPRLFERFFKSDDARSREGGGVGLGLAIALQNAQLLGGTIEVRSDPGTETVFRVVLPLRRPAEVEVGL